MTASSAIVRMSAEPTYSYQPAGGNGLAEERGHASGEHMRRRRSASSQRSVEERKGETRGCRRAVVEIEVGAVEEEGDFEKALRPPRELHPLRRGDTHEECIGGRLGPPALPARWTPICISFPKETGSGLLAPARARTTMMRTNPMLKMWARQAFTTTA